MSDWDQGLEHLIQSAAEFGYTRAQVLAWTRVDLIRFGDELAARVEIEQAGLAVARDMYRQAFGEEPPVNRGEATA